jgi:hypothetical protein
MIDIIYDSTSADRDHEFIQKPGCPDGKHDAGNPPEHTHVQHHAHTQFAEYNLPLKKQTGKISSYSS